MEQNGWFQDEAPAQRSVIVHDRTQILFPNRVVGLSNRQERPPKTPYLTPLKFFLWGYMTQKVYQTASANLTDILNRIAWEVQVLRPIVCF